MSRRFLSRVGSLIVPEVALVGLAIHAVRLALNATASLRWPHDPDLFRDIAAAQRLIDCHCLGDPFYRGETIWYNPLVPAIAAALSSALRVAVHLVYAQAGPLLNVLVVIAFYIVAVTTFGRLTGLLGTFAFVFLVSPEAPAWASATYSPWLFAGVFTQALFYLTLALNERARRSTGLGWSVAVGAALGVTFLGHTAPALLLGPILVVAAFTSGGQWRMAITRLSTELVTAAVVSAPLLYSIAGRYHLRVLNTMPASWPYAVRAVDMMPSFPPGTLWVTGLLLILGLVASFVDPDVRTRATSIWSWLIINLAWLAYAVVLVPAFVSMFGVALHPPVPAFHFVFYLRALACLFAGRGAAWAIQAAARSFSAARIEATVSLLALLTLVVSYTVVARAYAERHDLTVARSDAWKMSYRPVEEAAFDWIRRETRPDDVFLASNTAGLFVVGPAGRGLVVVDPFFSNPFVSWAARESASEQLWSAARQGEAGRFERLASPYRVRYLLTEDAAVAGDLERSAACFLRQRWRYGAVRVYEVRTDGAWPAKCG